MHMLIWPSMFACGIRAVFTCCVSNFKSHLLHLSSTNYNKGNNSFLITCYWSLTVSSLNQIFYGICWVDSSALILWTGLFPIEGVSGYFLCRLRSMADTKGSCCLSASSSSAVSSLLFSFNNFEGMYWFHSNFAELFITIKYRSSSIFVIIRQILAELWPFFDFGFVGVLILVSDQ